MQTDKKTSTSITLVLNETEAGWLNALMQNPINRGHPEYTGRPSDEDPNDRVIREKFFFATRLD